MGFVGEKLVFGTAFSSKEDQTELQATSLNFLHNNQPKQQTEMHYMYS